MDGGFRQSPLRLNEGLGACEVWDEQAIQKRAIRLAEQATKIWAFPLLAYEVLETYRNEGKEESGYSLSDHPYLHGGITRELFDVFRAEVLALDECVRGEAVLKLYIAFKAETNFVDAQAQPEHEVPRSGRSAQYLY